MFPRSAWEPDFLLMGVIYIRVADSFASSENQQLQTLNKGQTSKMDRIDLYSIILRFKWRIAFTFGLVSLESFLSILYPLLIGIAINDLIAGKYNGIIYLTILGITSLIVGSSRRFYDTRVYSGIYTQICPEMVKKEQARNSSISKISARSNLLTEMVEFLENSMPGIVGAVISLLGIIILIATLNIKVFLACLVLLALMIVVYTVTGKLNYKLNTKFNNQLEKEIDTLETKNIDLIKSFYKILMKWNIRLSDLETVNFAMVWVGAVALFIYTPIVVIGDGVLQYGLVFSILMYVFDYINNVVSFPMYIQQLIRLKEISIRLNESNTAT